MDAQTLVAVIAAAIAAAGALLTSLQVREARRQTNLQQKLHEDAHQPYVWVDFRGASSSPRLMRIHIENSGPTVATDVRITIDPPLKASSDRFQVDQYHAFADAIPSLPPGRVMAYYYGRSDELLADEQVPRQHKIRITGMGPFGPMPTLEYVLSLEDLRHREAITPGTLHQIREAIDEVAKGVAKLS